MRLSMGMAIACVAATVLLYLPVGAAYQHKFVGTAKCRICHMSPKKGNQYGIWKSSPHAEAYNILAGEESKKVAAKAGAGDKPPQENPACLKCHVTGWDAPEEMKDPKYDKTDGVTCESCHGPGGDYWPISVMKEKEKAVASGLVIPDQKTCLKCHNQESPTYKPFKWDTFWPKIAHDDPMVP